MRWPRGATSQGACIKSRKVCAQTADSCPGVVMRESSMVLFINRRRLTPHAGQWFSMKWMPQLVSYNSPLGLQGTGSLLLVFAAGANCPFGRTSRDCWGKQCHVALLSEVGSVSGVFITVTNCHINVASHTWPVQLVPYSVLQVKLAGCSGSLI